jgi:hypothetical protein
MEMAGLYGVNRKVERKGLNDIEAAFGSPKVYNLARTLQKESPQTSPPVLGTVCRAAEETADDRPRPYPGGFWSGFGKRSGLAK